VRIYNRNGKNPQEIKTTRCGVSDLKHSNGIIKIFRISGFSDRIIIVEIDNSEEYMCHC